LDSAKITREFKKRLKSDKRDHLIFKWEISTELEEGLVIAVDRLLFISIQREPKKGGPIYP
jgi:hypothetical protein